MDTFRDKSEHIKYYCCSPLVCALYCKYKQKLPEKRGEPTYPITAETAGVNAPVFSSLTFTTWGTFFRVDSVKEVLTALREKKKGVNIFSILSIAINIVSQSNARRNPGKFLEGIWYISPKLLAISAFSKDAKEVGSFSQSSYIFPCWLSKSNYTY